MTLYSTLICLNYDYTYNTGFGNEYNTLQFAKCVRHLIDCCHQLIQDYDNIPDH